MPCIAYRLPGPRPRAAERCQRSRHAVCEERPMLPPARHQPSPVRNGLLAPPALRDLGRLRPGLRPVELPFDQTLYPADGKTEAVLFVESGMVSLLATLEDGEQVEVGVVGREGLVGLPLVLGDDRSLLEARVQQEGTALRM